MMYLRGSEARKTEYNVKELMRKFPMGKCDSFRNINGSKVFYQKKNIYAIYICIVFTVFPFTFIISKRNLLLAYKIIHIYTYIICKRNKKKKGIYFSWFELNKLDQYCLKLTIMFYISITPSFLNYVQYFDYYM